MVNTVLPVILQREKGCGEDIVTLENHYGIPVWMVEIPLFLTFTSVLQICSNNLTSTEQR